MARRQKPTYAQRNALAWYAGIGPHVYVTPVTTDTLVAKQLLVVSPEGKPVVTEKGRRTLNTGYIE